VQCIEFRVLLRVMESARISQGGVLKPVSVIEREMFGQNTATIVSMGALAFTDSNGNPLPDRPKPGDVVITSKYAGITMRDKEFNLFRFANDKDVVAIVKGAGT
jgi:co-chaperonin GroES (HSP10)